MPNPLRPKDEAILFATAPREKLFAELDIDTRILDPLLDIHSFPPIGELERRIIKAAARCTDCGVAPCARSRPLNQSTGCPLNNPHEWLDLAARGDLAKAVEMHNRTTLLWGMYGALCWAPCEHGCIHTDSTLSGGIRSLSGAIAIKDVEYALWRYGLEHNLFKPAECLPLNGKRVAVVGAGPAGLEAAHALALLGYEVVCFDKLDAAGGLMRYEIPTPKMPKELLDFTIDLYVGEGIQFELSAPITRREDALDLLKDFDAVILCTGAPMTRYSMLPGDNNRSAKEFEPFVVGASQFLEEVERRTRADIEAGPKLLQGKSILVAGNGLTAADVITKSLRAGAACVEVLDKYHAPRTEHEQAKTTAHEELLHLPHRGRIRYSSILHTLERHTAAVTAQVLDTQTGQIERKTYDQVVMAVGYTGANPHIHELFGVKMEAGLARADLYSGRTSRAKVWCCGDAVHGAKNLVEAGAAGKRCALDVHITLMGLPPDPVSKLSSTALRTDSRTALVELTAFGGAL